MASSRSIDRAPAAVRAVGAAIGRNPASLVVPCHRVLAPMVRSPAMPAAWTQAGAAGAGGTRMKTNDLADWSRWRRSGRLLPLHAPGRRRVRPGGAGRRARRRRGTGADAAAALARPDGRAAPPLARDRRRRRHQLGPALPLLQLRRVGYQRRAVVDLQRPAPLWGALVAWCWLRERPTLAHASGWRSASPAWWASAWEKASFKPGGSGWAIVACLAAALCYGFSANFTKKRLQGVAPMAVAAGSQLAAALLRWRCRRCGGGRPRRPRRTPG